MRKVRIGLENCEKHFQEELMMVVAQTNLREMGIKIFSYRIVTISKKNWTFVMSGQCPVGIAD